MLVVLCAVATVPAFVTSVRTVHEVVQDLGKGQLAILHTVSVHGLLLLALVVGATSAGRDRVMAWATAGVATAVAVAIAALLGVNAGPGQLLGAIVIGGFSPMAMILAFDLARRAARRRRGGPGTASAVGAAA